MARKRGAQDLRPRRRRGRTTSTLVNPRLPHTSELLERSAERSRQRWRGWQRHVWGDGGSTAWERRSRAAWFVRALELGGVARRRLLRSIAVDAVVLVVVVVVVVAVAR